jgi:hypothetical protein
MKDEDYYIQLKSQVDVLQKILNDLQPNNFDWRYSIHKYYNDGDDGLMG